MKCMCVCLCVWGGEVCSIMLIFDPILSSTESKSLIQRRAIQAHSCIVSGNHGPGTRRVSWSAKEAGCLLLCSSEPSNLSCSKYNFLYTRPLLRARSAKHTNDSDTRSRCRCQGAGGQMSCALWRDSAMPGKIRVWCAAGDFLGWKGRRKLHLLIK